MTTDALPIVDLDDLEGVAGHIVLKRRVFNDDGSLKERVEVTHDVLSIDGRGADLIQEYRARLEAGAKEGMPLTVLRSIVADVVPTLLPDEVKWLTHRQCMIVFGIATRQLENVRAFVAAMNAPLESAIQDAGTTPKNGDSGDAAGATSSRPSASASPGT